MKPGPLSIPQTCYIHLEMRDLFPFPFPFPTLSSGEATCLGHKIDPQGPLGTSIAGLHGSAGAPFPPTREALQPSVCMQGRKGLGPRLWALLSTVAGGTKAVGSSLHSGWRARGGGGRARGGRPSPPGGRGGGGGRPWTLLRVLWTLSSAPSSPHFCSPPLLSLYSTLTPCGHCCPPPSPLRMPEAPSAACCSPWKGGKAW